MAAENAVLPTGPLLVGVIDSAEALERAAAGAAGLAGVVDLVEARVDLFDAPAGTPQRWTAACARLEAAGTRVLVTIRLAAEGGRWTAPDAERLPLFHAAIAAASWIDVEAASPIAAEVASAARAGGRTSVLSHHDFARTPPLPELLRIVDGCRARGGDVAKVATAAAGQAERDILLALLAARPEATCVIGMGTGAEAEALRVTLAARGSLLAYGYLERPTAPGQTSAAEMDRRLRAASLAYAARRV